MVFLESVIDGPALDGRWQVPAGCYQHSVGALVKLRLSGIHVKGRFVVVTALGSGSMTFFGTAISGC
jgi:hypothetical protein